METNAPPITLRGAWIGKDGYEPGISTLAALRVYHLMAGGIEDRRLLSRYSGLTPQRLAKLNLDEIFLSVDDLWLHLRDFFKQIDLPSERALMCGRCGRVVDALPCRNGCPQDFSPPPATHASRS